jgi:hypothetical protein
VLHITRAQNNEYIVFQLVMTIFNFFQFLKRFSSGINKLSKYVLCFICKIMLK